jgi:hypothetical protein
VVMEVAGVAVPHRAQPLVRVRVVQVSAAVVTEAALVTEAAGEFHCVCKQANSFSYVRCVCMVTEDCVPSWDEFTRP